MLRNHFKIAWRNLVKHPVHSLINTAGLAIGLAACLLILQFVSFELSYDQFNKNYKDLYRVTNDRYQNGKLTQHGTITYSGVGKAMRTDYPEVLNNTRVMPYGSLILTINEKKIEAKRGLAVDNSFLSMFSYPLFAGNPQNALTQPNDIILDETLARKIFGVTDNHFESLIGKTVQISRDSLPYKITGICKDVPENSHLQFDMLISYVTLYSGKNSYTQADYDFTDSDFWHYIQLKPGASYKALEAKLPAFSDRYFHGSQVSGSVEKFHLQPVARAHLYSDYEYEIGKTGSATAVWGMLIIATLIIVIAWVNYINLTTARSMERAKEVGVRKVAGATKPQLIRQFLTESLLINLISLIAALVIVFLTQNAFNHLVQHKLSLQYLFQQGLNGFNVTTALIVLVVAGIFVSGFYPAFILSSFRPILILKGKYINSGKGVFLRKALVVGQFAATVALIIGSFVVYKQIRFVSTQNLGLNMSRVLIVKPPILTSFDSSFIQHENSFKEELKQLPNVIQASTTERIAGDELARTFNVHRTDRNQNDKISMRRLGIDQHFLDLYGVKLVAGRNFIFSDYNADYSKLHHVILNASAISSLGFTSNADAIGKTIFIYNANWDITGVVADFHQKSLHYPIEPTMFMPTMGSDDPISVKLNSRDLPSTIQAIKKKYSTFFPGNLFDYFFLDEKFNEQYQNDILFGKVFGLFAGFAIFIASLGLLGLALFTTAQRTKEIGVRKVLGATVPSIVVLLSTDFLRLILLAFVIASPIAWLVMHNWLQSFAYRIAVSWWIFPAAGLLACIIAMATIGYQAVKAAGANPVRSLRSE
jgi:putative ABC transport system permease protein